MTAIDGRMYVGGQRTPCPPDLQDAADALERSGGVAWIGLMDPGPDEIETAAARFGLHPLAVEDAHKGHQRAKLERYGDTMFVVLRPASYNDHHERVDFGEVHLFIGPQFVITVRHGAVPDLSAVRDALEGEPQFLSTGPEAMLTAFLDAVVDGYAPVVAGLVNDIDEVEDSLFGEGNADPALSERIYRLRNVLDHTIRVTERVDGSRSLLENALTVHSTLVTTEQNEAMQRMPSASLAQGEGSRRLAEETIDQGEQVKKISSWAAILYTPTLIAPSTA